MMKDEERQPRAAGGPGRSCFIIHNSSFILGSILTSRDVSHDPVWRGEELGRPIPASPHAVSVALPRWQDVVGYEEKKPEVINALTSGYPRFFIHAQVKELARQIGGDQPCLPFPSL